MGTQQDMVELTKIDARFDALDARFAAVDARLDAIEQKLDTAVDLTYP